MRRRSQSFGWSCLLLAAMGGSPSTSQQKPVSLPKFEVASIKPCKADTWGTDGGGLSPGRLIVHCDEVANLVRRAYSIFRDGQTNERGRLTKIDGGPAWAYSDRYEIEAIADRPRAPSMMEGPMMQALLEDRFKLKVHAEMRDVPVYVLTVAKGGIKAPAATRECFVIGMGGLPAVPPLLPPAERRFLRCGHAVVASDEFHLHGATIADLANALSWIPFDRRFVDRSGIAGRFNFDFQLLALGPQEPSLPMPVTGLERRFEMYQAALRKIGLKVDLGKAPGEFLIIDRLERPSPN